MQDERNGEPAKEQLSISYTFRHVYRFILRAVQGDVTVASGLFQRYLAGELPEELLALSRRYVGNDQNELGSLNFIPCRCPQLPSSNETKECGRDLERVKGTAEKVKDTIKETAGKVIGNKKPQAEGKFDKAKGSAHNLAGDVNDAARDASRTADD